MATSVSSTTSTTSTATTKTDSATIGSQLATALGGGTGIDMTALAGNLASAEFAGRLSNLDSSTSKLETQISQASQLKSDLLSLSTSLGNLVRGGSLAATPSVANASVASASLPIGSSGGSGSYSLEVSQLAAPQVLSSVAFGSSATPPGAGTLTLRFGSVSGTSFTADSSRSAVNVTIAAGATLADVATAINSAGSGVTAYVAQTSDGARLVFKGPTGANNAFTVSATEDSANPGLSALAWTPATDAGRLATSAKDAQFKLDGISRTAGSNSIDSVAPGLSLKLTGTNVGQPTTISFSDPTSAISGAMQDLTTALNSLVSEVNTALDPSGGGLSNDPATRAVKRQLSQLTGTTIMPNAASGDPRTLSELGLSVNKDGTFTLDTAKLTSMLSSKPAAVASMFTNGLYGVYATVDAMTRKMTAATDSSSLGGAIDKYTKLKTTLADQRTKLTTQQDKVRSRLIDQFAAANKNVAASKSTLAYVQNQIAAWNKSS